MTRDAVNPPDPAGDMGREDRDALLSAYALGELEGAELAAVERLLADPEAHEARRIVAENRAVAEALVAARDADALTPSPVLRRAVVAALAAAPGPSTPTRTTRPSRRLISGLLAMTGALAATLLVAVTLVPSVRIARDVARRDIAPPVEPATAPAATAAQADATAAAADRTLLAPRPPAATADPRNEQSGQGQSARPATAGRLHGAPADAAPDLAMPVAADESVFLEELEGLASGLVEARGPTSAGVDMTDGQVIAPGIQSAGVPRRVAAACAIPQAGRFDRLDAAPRDDEQGERYSRFAENRFLAVADSPLSTFSIDVDTASYAVARRFLAAGRLPPADAVRIEEFVNYFRYSYPRPDGDDPFAVALEAADCPWHAGHRLVRIGIAGREIDRRERPSGNLVFLVDVSGSMDDPDKLPLVKQALAMLVEELTENDRVSIVTYAGDAGLKLPPTSGDQKRKILDAIEGLSAGGSTHGSAGITLAYDQARERFIAGGANRVILCTDGDLNVGITSDAALVDLVQDKARGGTFLTVLGFGRGNLQDEKLETLADKGNGVYAYVDSAREARKVLVEQLTGSTITIAKDVKIQVEFNPAQVASYRLLGYENRRLAAADFRDDRKDAGEIGAGHTVTALYEIVPAGGVAADGDDPGAGAEPLKYRSDTPVAAAPAPAGPASRELLTVKLRFKQPEGDTSVLREFPLADHGGAFAAASADTRFAAAVAAFGMILRNSEFKGEATLPMVAEVAGDALGSDDGGYRAEFLDLVRKAEAHEATERR